MKYIILFHGKWENPQPFSFTNSLNIINCCANEGNGGNNEFVDDGEHMNYESHEFTSRDEDAFVREVDVLVRTFVLDIEQQSELL